MNTAVYGDAGQLLVSYQRAQIDYVSLYIALYVAYNAWYSYICSTKNDRKAIDALKKRYVIWDEYCTGQIMRHLRVYMEQLAELTQREPLTLQNKYWLGEVGHAKDWQSLIEYWYQVRCLVVHGSPIKKHYVLLAYETLSVFMDEIVERIRLQRTARGSRTWHVDMQRGAPTMLH